MVLVLVCNWFCGKGVLQVIIDLFFVVLFVIVGVLLILLWGLVGVLGFVEQDFGFKIIFGLLGIVFVSMFVICLFVVCEVEFVLYELGIDQEQVVVMLGFGWWQIFW